jgi:hypothetical protein
VHFASFGTQATPIFEHAASPPGDRWQVRQPSDHSRQAALGGASGLALAGDGGGAVD